MSDHSFPVLGNVVPIGTSISTNSYMKVKENFSEVNARYLSAKKRREVKVKRAEGESILFKRHRESLPLSSMLGDKLSLYIRGHQHCFQSAITHLANPESVWFNQDVRLCFCSLGARDVSRKVH